MTIELLQEKTHPVMDVAIVGPMMIGLTTESWVNVVILTTLPTFTTAKRACDTSQLKTVGAC